MQNTTYDIAFVGDFARDIIVHGGNHETSSGGSVYYGGIAAAHLGARTAIVTRLHPRDSHWLEEVKAAGVTVYVQEAPQTSGIENIYHTADMDRRECHPIGFAGLFDLDSLPDVQAATFMIGPLMAGIVSLDLVRHFAAKSHVALDVQGFVRVPRGNDLVTEDWPEKEEGLALVHTVKLDRAEAEVLTGLTDPLAALKTVAAWGPKEIVLTHASGLTVWADGEICQAPFVARSLEGRTGRGDTSIASYLVRRFTAEPADACRFAAAATSLKLSVPGPLQATLADVEELARTLPVTVVE